MYIGRISSCTNHPKIFLGGRTTHTVAFRGSKQLARTVSLVATGLDPIENALLCKPSDMARRQSYSEEII